MTKRPITIVLADDHQIWRSGVRADLGDGFEVVGEAGTAPDAIALVELQHPDVVLCDLNMPGGGGMAVVRACGTLARIVILTVSEAERDLLDAVAAGAFGYLVKSTPPEELRAALQRVAAGEPVFSPALAALVLGEFRKLSGVAGAGAGAAGGAGVKVLSVREREVLQLVARGHTYREIGAELYISQKTVENHVRNILGKLHLNRKNELIRYALEHGIG